MGKLRGPRWDVDYEKWRKLLLLWLRLQDKDTTDGEIVAAVILGLSESQNLKNGDSVIDIVLDLDDSELHPAAVTVPQGTEDTRQKYQLKDESRPIDGLTNILNTLKSKYGAREEVQLFKCYEEFESLIKDRNECMNDYILKFERLYKRLERNSMVLPDLVLACRLMKSANLGKDEILVGFGRHFLS